MQTQARFAIIEIQEYYEILLFHLQNILLGEVNLWSKPQITKILECMGDVQSVIGAWYFFIFNKDKLLLMSQNGKFRKFYCSAILNFAV